MGFGLVLARHSQNKLIWFKRALLFVEEWRQNNVIPYFQTTHNTLCLAPTFYTSTLLGLSVVPREINNNVSVKYIVGEKQIVLLATRK